MVLNITEVSAIYFLSSLYLIKCYVINIMF